MPKLVWWGSPAAPETADSDAVEPVEAAVLKLVPREICEKHQVIPIRRNGPTLIVAMADPSVILPDVQQRGDASPCRAARVDHSPCRGLAEHADALAERAFVDLEHRGDPPGSATGRWNRRRGGAMERGDLADPRRAVALGDVADHLLEPVHAEGDVEVGHADALRVEEAL